MKNKGKKPSQTALKVSLNIIALSNVPEVANVLPDGIVNMTSKILSASKATPQRRIDIHHTPRVTSLYKKFDWLLPGQFVSFAYRKVFCENSVREAIEKGATQVLVLGAGYDTLGMRLAPQYPNVKFFEIDSPSTAHSKIEGLVKIGKPENLIVIPEDLGEKALKKVLEENNDWDSEAKSVIIAEGLLQYLAPSAVKELFIQCNDITGEGSKIAFTYTGKGKNGRPYAGPHTKLVMWILKITGEPWLWSATKYELKNLLNETGWKHSESDNIYQNKSGIEFYAAASK
jgi:methyltransferase (TIGR00027 family)